MLFSKHFYKVSITSGLVCGGILPDLFFQVTCLFMTARVTRPPISATMVMTSER